VLAVLSLVFSVIYTENNLFAPLIYFFLGLFIEHLIFAFGLAYKVRSINTKMAQQYQENERIKTNQKQLLQKELINKEKEIFKLTGEAELKRTSKLKSKYESEAH